MLLIIALNSFIIFLVIGISIILLLLSQTQLYFFKSKHQIPSDYLEELKNLCLRALDSKDVPIASILVYKGEIIGRGYNQVEKLNDPTAHAEILAITAASNHLRSKVLTDCDLYVTVEPCLMCIGAITLSKIRNLYFRIFKTNHRKS